MNLTKEENDNFLMAGVCHICNDEFTKKDIKCRDHCHLTGM